MHENPLQFKHQLSRVELANDVCKPNQSESLYDMLVSLQGDGFLLFKFNNSFKYIM